jgi:hypothetical protein
MYSNLILKTEKELCKTGDDIPNAIRLVVLGETLTPFLCDQNVKFNTPLFVTDELSVKHSTALT